MINNPCQQLKQLYQNFSKFNREKIDLDLLVEQGSIQELISLEDTVTQRVELYEIYKTEVKGLLREWYDNDEFIRNIQFEPGGRVVVDGDLIVEFHQGVFPSVIRKVNGKLEIVRDGIKSIDHLEEVGGPLVLNGIKSIESMASLKEVGEISLIGTRITSFPKLHTVHGRFLAKSNEFLQELPDLEYVGGNFQIPQASQLETIPKLSVVKGDLTAAGASKLRGLPLLEVVDGKLDINDTDIKELPNLFIVGGHFQLWDSNLESLPLLREVQGEVLLSETRVKGLPNLVKARSIRISECPNFRDLESLKESGYLILAGTKVNSLPELVHADYFECPQTLTEAPKLETVGTLIMKNTNIKQFPLLREIEERLVLRYPGVNNFRRLFPSLKIIGVILDNSTRIS
jgi:hypothetical protein